MRSFAFVASFLFLLTVIYFQACSPLSTSSDSSLDQNVVKTTPEITTVPQSKALIGPAGQKYTAYLSENLCTVTKADDCMKATSYIATRSDGRKVKVTGVYTYYDKDAVQGLVLPHFLLSYMRLLREAYREDQTTYGALYYNQIDFLLTQTVIRGDSRVWENIFGYAQAMEQAEYAAYFASLASTEHSLGNLKNAEHYFNISLQLAKSLQVKVGKKSGGVRSNVYQCGSQKSRARPCAWFHSRGLGVPGEDKVYAVLNQHLHAVRDGFSAYLTLMPLVAQLGLGSGAAAEVDEIGDTAISGLYHLAFSPGTSPKAQQRLPNLRQFMEPLQNSSGQRFYWSYYEFNMKSGKMANISHARTCHYHTHVLDLVAGLNIMLDDSKTHTAINNLPEGWKVFEALDHLLEGSGEALGQAQSTHGIYQFFLSENDPQIKYNSRRCPKLPTEVLPKKSRDFYLNAFSL